MNYSDRWHRYRDVVFTICLLLVIGLIVWFRGFLHPARIIPPNESYGELFYNAVNSDALFGKDALFADEKAFLDATPRLSNEQVRAAFLHDVRSKSPQALRGFVLEHFLITEQHTHTADTTSHYLPIRLRIRDLWGVLRRYPTHSEVQGTHIPLSKPYTVPGGRFREMYYWDSYFTILGLLVDGYTTDARHMLDNFATLLQQYGFIPNGTRTYYGTRSQPPFFSHMVEALVLATRDSTLLDTYASALRTEYDFWMRGHTMLTRYTPAVLRTIRMADGEILNRYYDNAAIPRAENYRADYAAGQLWSQRHGGANATSFYRHLRASSESGWDNASRWLINPTDPLTINTTNIVPVDLNALLYHAEQLLATMYRYLNQPVEAERFVALAEARRRAIHKYFWQPHVGYFVDVTRAPHKPTGIYTTAGLMPLFVGLATQRQAARVADFVRQNLLHAGGLACSAHTTGYKWDAPTGSAPGQWIAYVGFRRSGQCALADDVSHRWRKLVATHYYRTHELYDRYNVVNDAPLAGEYTTQLGFGWTNAVFQLFEHYHFYPQACPISSPDYLRTTDERNSASNTYTP